MSWKFVLGCAAGLALAANGVAAETRILSASVRKVEDGQTFQMVTGIPKVLTQDGVTIVGDGTLARNTIYVFPEMQGATLKSALRPGVGGQIPAGTRVDSFYVCIDTSEAPSDPGPRNGAQYAAVVRFDNSALLGIALRPPQLAATAKAVGKPGVVYANSRYVGVDPFWMGQDDQTFAGGTFYFSGDANGIDCRRLIFRAKG